MRVRVRGPNGVTTISLAETASVGDLRRGISSASGVTGFDVKKGYPPEPLVLDAYTDDTLIVDTGMKLNGEQLIVARRDVDRQVNHQPTSPLAQAPLSSGAQSTSKAQRSSQDPTRSSKPVPPTSAMGSIEDDAPEVPIPSRDATMMLRVMPSDNSCLFRAFSYLMFGPGIDSMHELRSLVASTIQSNPEKYSDAILGKPRGEYCQWIQTEYSWGGYVELIILSQHFQIGVASINVQDGRVDFYNEEARNRCILVYSGIHYDAITLSPNAYFRHDGKAAPEEDIKAFDNTDEVVLTTALDLCKVLRDRNYHVDVSNMGAQKLKCLICGWSGNGMDEVSKHVSETGHTSLSQT